MWLHVHSQLMKTSYQNEILLYTNVLNSIYTYLGTVMSIRIIMVVLKVEEEVKLSITYIHLDCGITQTFLFKYAQSFGNINYSLVNRSNVNLREEKM